MNKLEGKMVDYFKEVIMPELLNDKSSCHELDMHVVVREVTKTMSMELIKRGEKGVWYKVCQALKLNKISYYKYIKGQ